MNSETVKPMPRQRRDPDHAAQIDALGQDAEPQADGEGGGGGDADQLADDQRHRDGERNRGRHHPR